jgi:hypothetical protein
VFKSFEGNNELEFIECQTFNISEIVVSPKRKMMTELNVSKKSKTEKKRKKKKRKKKERDTRYTNENMVLPLYKVTNCLTSTQSLREYKYGFLRHTITTRLHY